MLTDLLELPIPEDEQMTVALLIPLVSSEPKSFHLLFSPQLTHGPCQKRSHSLLKVLDDHEKLMRIIKKLNEYCNVIISNRCCIYSE